MRKIILLSTLFLLGVFVSNGLALPSGLIHDTYLHPNDNEGYQQDDDVIGALRNFDIFGHIWEDDSLKIYLRWGAGLGGEILNAKLGDVFLYDASGTDLQYYIPISDHDPGDNVSIYNVQTTRLSNYYFGTYPTSKYGDNEIVTGVGTELAGSATVGWTPDASAADENIISLLFASNSEFIGRDIRFSFTCGNDVHAPEPVPEPATMLLLGVGLIGLAGLVRKKLRKSIES